MDFLPINAKRDEIVGAVQSNKVVIVKGETGCGKTLQLPIILHEMGLSQRGTIVVAEPRRAAATSVAEYVAAEIGTDLGDRVGYHVRYGNVSVHGTAIKFVTNGILLREMLSRSLFERYSALIIDEAHERSLEIDLLLGLAKRAVRIRPDFRVVLASATINAEALSTFFDDAPVIEVPGRNFPVTVSWHRRTLPRLDWMVRGVAKRIMSILQETTEGDILVFMPGRQSIDDVVSEVWSLGGGRIVTLPFHKDMEAGEYRRIFEEFPGMRKVIVATNIAETSLTLPSVKFVIDSGLIKEVDYDSTTGIESLSIAAHSQSGCVQRIGRVGRVSEGTCYRLYPEPSFETRPAHTKPEILRRNLSGTWLYLKALGFEDPSFFELVDKPEPQVWQHAKDELCSLGILSTGDTELTKTGKLIASLPVSPQVGCLIAEAVKRGCVKEIVTYAAFLSAPRIFPHLWNDEEKVRQTRSLFMIPHSDVLTILNVWKGYVESGQSKGWCEEHFVCPHALGEVALAREHLSRILLDQGIRMSSNADSNVLLETIVSSSKGYLLKLEADGSYKGVFRDLGKVVIHPESALMGTAPEYIVAMSILKMQHIYAIQCSAVSTEAVLKLFPQLTPKLEPVVSPTIVRKKKKAKKEIEVAPAPKKTVVEQKITLVFIRHRSELLALYGKSSLKQFEPGSLVPEAGKLYSCTIFSCKGVLSVQINEEVTLSGAKPQVAVNGNHVSVRRVVAPPKSRVNPNLQVSGELVGLAADLASTWQCRLDD